MYDFLVDLPCADSVSLELAQLEEYVPSLPCQRLVPSVLLQSAKPAMRLTVY